MEAAVVWKWRRRESKGVLVRILGRFWVIEEEVIESKCLKGN